MCFDGLKFFLCLLAVKCKLLTCFYDILTEKSLLCTVTGRFFSMTTSQWCFIAADLVGIGDFLSVTSQFFSNL
jgi:hypothetical protein